LLGRFAPLRKRFAFVAGNDNGSYGGGTLAIGLRCASAATVDVPIGPFSS
jgi:hypothetical protein